jgi:hypothetical protein
MNLPIYALNPPDKYRSKTEQFDHGVYLTDKQVQITPLVFSKKTITPNNFFKLKTKLGLSSILIIDRLRPSGQKVCIINHINRAGNNFLIGKTPLLRLPRFPDMSNIYNPIPGLKTLTVHTVGPERFLAADDKLVTISESVGLISPVWHYVGTKVFAQNCLP